MSSYIHCAGVDTLLVLLILLMALVIVQQNHTIKLCLLKASGNARSSGSPSPYTGSRGNGVLTSIGERFASTSPSCAGSTIVCPPSSYSSSNQDAESVRGSSNTHEQDLAGIQSRSSSASAGREIADSEFTQTLMPLLEAVDYSATGRIDRYADELAPNHVTFRAPDGLAAPGDVFSNG